jgi:hypothetical protein
MDSNCDAQPLNRGIIHLPVIFGTVVIVITAILFAPKVVSELIASPTPVPTETIEQTPESTFTPSPTPSATPTATPTPRPSASLTPLPSTTPRPTVAAVSGPPGSGYSSYTIGTEKGNFSISVVSIDMGGVRMVTDTANDNDCAADCPTKSLADYVSQHGAFAGMNGTYFCPPDYADCASKKNSFDYPVFSSRLGKWINATNLFWNDRSMMYQEGGQMRFRRNAASGASGSAAIVNAPGLLEGGNVIVNSFPLTATQQSKGTRGGIGIRGNVTYLVIARSATMEEFAYIFKAMGATDALNLDGGGSTALWFGGYKAGPGRSLPNAVLFVR